MSLIPSTILPGSLDSWEYFASYSDLRSWAMSDSVLNAADSLNAATHYNAHAVGEGRTITFDAWEYIASNSDLINWFRTGGVTDDDAIVATQHYIAHGATEHRLTHTFNAWEYLASNADLRDWLGADGITDADAVTAAKHYIASGANEGRAIDTFDAAEYLRLNDDLRGWLGATNYEAAAKHYVESGHRENRPGTPESTYTLKATQDIVSAYNFVSAPVYTPGGDNFVNTLQNVDILTGLGSHATLDATLDNYNDNGYLIAPKLHNIESVTVHFRETYGFGINGAASPYYVSLAVLDLQDSDHALKNVSVDGISVGGFIVENLHSEATNLSVNLSNAAPVIAFSYLSHELAGTNDTVTLSLTDVYANYLLLGSNENLNLGYSGSGSATEQIEHVVLNSYGDPSVKLVDLRPDVSPTTHQDLTINAFGDLILGQDWDGDHNFIEHNNAFTPDTVESLNKITVTGSGNVTLASVGNGHFSLDLLGSGLHGFELAAGTATGKIAVNISNAAADATALFTTGSNDDTVLVDHLFAQYYASSGSSGSASGSNDTDITFAGHLVTGSGNDSVTANDLGTGNLASNYIGAIIDTGADNDVVSVDVLGGSNGKPGAGDYAGATIDLGAGNDILNADHLETEARVIAGAGNDVVNLKEHGSIGGGTPVYIVIAGDTTGLTADGNGAEVLLGEGNDQLNIELLGTSLYSANFHSAGSGGLDALIKGYVDGGSGTDTLSVTGNKKGDVSWPTGDFLEVVHGNTSHRIDGSGAVTGHSITSVEIVNLTSSTSYDSGDVSTFNGLGERKIVANDNNDYTADYALNRGEFDNNDTLPGSLTINLIHEDGVIRNQASEELPWIGHAGDAAHDYLYNLTGTEVITISALETSLLDNGSGNTAGVGTGNVSADDFNCSRGLYGHGTFTPDLILDLAHDASTGDKTAEITLKDVNLSDPTNSPLDPGDVNYDVKISDLTSGSGVAYTALALTVGGADQHGVDLNNDFLGNLTVTGSGVTTGGHLTIINIGDQADTLASTVDTHLYDGNVYLGIESSVNHTITTGSGDDVVRLGDETAIHLGNDTISVGDGNDIVVFNGLAVGSTTDGSGLVISTQNTAGLTIGDFVDGGSGTNDILAFGGKNAIDGIGGNLVGVTIGHSEWVNVKNFETIQLSVGQAEPVSYFLEITNQLVDNNGGTTGNILNIINNNAGTCGSGIHESNTTLDLRGIDSLSYLNQITYDGAVGVGSGSHGSNDRFIFNDVNLDGGDTINGGAADGASSTWGGNNDILEVRAGTSDVVVTAATDLQYISNVGTIVFNNDGVGAHTMHLDLTDTIVNALVDNVHMSTSAQSETLFIYANDYTNGSTASAVLDVTASALTNRSNLYIEADDIHPGADHITTGGGADTIFGFGGNDYINAGSGDDQITGGLGADTLYGGVGNDSFYFHKVDGSASGTFTGYDTIADFGAGDGIYLDRSTIVLAGVTPGSPSVSSIAHNAFDCNGSVGVAFINNAYAASLQSTANVSTAIGTIANESVGESAYFVVQDGASGHSGIYAFTSVTADGTVAANELALIGVTSTTGAVVTDFHTFL